MGIPVIIGQKQQESFHARHAPISCWNIVKSNRLLLLDVELAALNEAVSSWRLFACSFLSSRINSERWASSCKVSVTALICQATSSNVKCTLGDVSLLSADILLEVVFYPVFNLSITPFVVSFNTYGPFHTSENGLILFYCWLNLVGLRSKVAVVR